MCNSNSERIDPRDKLVIRALQDDFPLCEEPFKVLAERIGMSEEEFIERVKALSSEKKIRKMGAVLRHREAGFVANALCAWNVPPERLDETAATMIKHPAVSHCYDRNTAPDWNYNLYTMIHAKSREECERIIAELAAECGLDRFQILYTTREWKKTSMRYFVENQGVDVDQENSSRCPAR